MASQDPECRLVNVGSWFSMTGYALAFPRNSRYYEKFNMKMLEYRKNGEFTKLQISVHVLGVFLLSQKIRHLLHFTSFEMKNFAL